MSVLSSWSRACPLLLAAACSFNPATGTDGGPDAPDADGGDDPEAGTGGSHLLLTEIQVIAAYEFIEIYNPTSATVDLRDYYLTDSNEYWKLPGHGTTQTIELNSTDFVARFPLGASLAPGGVAVIAIDGPGFVTEYGITPTYTVRVPVAGAGLMEPAVIGIGTMTVSLTNEGEMVSLFHWDGTSDLVQDVDLVVSGNAPIEDNTVAEKSPVDGPDPNTNTSSYATDALTIQDFPDDASGRRSFKRIAGEASREAEAGGNGITGHDETSEQTRSTWDNAASNGTPGEVPAF